ncbi:MULTISPECIES: ScbA/BarX family gamma-butyrolactone biosynthesis protein [unclassified Streptomyces]|uniref:ScbA/BarX family gamma-butyrolactone biosynthesis protein n=1 Tax=unclassified Streptomyces TaxID=2593676 RepID=UPI0036F1491D
MSGVFQQELAGPVMAVHQNHVHKTNGAEVLLSSWRVLGRDSYRVSAHWPRAHSFYHPVHGLHDPLLLAESVRQAVPLLSHVAYGVPFGHRQAWEHLHFDLNSVAMMVTTAPAEVDLHITCSDIVRRGSRLAALTMAVDVVLAGQRLGTARTRFNNQPPVVYQRLRGRYADLARATADALPPGPPVAPELVARTRPEDVVLSATDDRPGHWQLRVDLAHPVLFDHPVDHAPGMLLLEAARQAAHAVTDRPSTVVGMETEFTRYAEFDAPCHVWADLLPSDPQGRRRVLVTLEQNGLRIFSADVTLETAAAL